MIIIFDITERSSIPPVPWRKYNMKTLFPVFTDQKRSPAFWWYDSMSFGLVLHDNEIESDFKGAREECNGAQCNDDDGRGGVGHHSVYRHVELNSVWEWSYCQLLEIYNIEGIQGALIIKRYCRAFMLWWIVAIFFSSQNIYHYAIVHLGLFHSR
jgi:hypothetical protein